MLDALFRPKAVAVVGASAKELNVGNRIIKNLVDFGFTGKIYPINPKVDEIRGVKAYKSILDVPTDVDVVHLPIPAASVPPVIDECGRKGVKFVILNGGGFAETGAQGEAIEQDCMTRAKKHNIRIFGPNCQGIINTAAESRAYCNFTFTKPNPGVVSLIALSGGVAELLHQSLFQMGVGTRMYASNGNACDVSIPEIIKYYGEDEGTQAIVLYVEGLRDPDTFLKVAQKVVAKKPILAMKAGRTEEGARAAASHTGGLAKKDITTDLIFEKAGILCFHDEQELCQAAAVFTTQPLPKGRRVGVITNTGGPSVIATDVLVSGSLTTPPLSEKTRAILTEKLLKEVTVRNPVDVLATANADHFRAALDALMDDDAIDSIYISMVTPFFVDHGAIARQIVEVNRFKRKPIVCTLMTDKEGCAETVNILRKGGVPCYDFPSTAARVLVSLTRYSEIRRRQAGRIKHFHDADRVKAQAIVNKARNIGQARLPADDVYEIMRAYGIPVADWKVAKDAAGALIAAREIGFPVAIKADSQSILHKSEMGAVVTNLSDEAHLAQAIERIGKTCRAPDLRFIIQRHVEGGKEVIVGAKADPELGHLIMFGMGGVYVEVLNDVAFRLAPITDVEAREMILSLKAAPILKGVRGERGVDRERLAEIIERVSQLMIDVPDIREIDLNPVIAFEDRACAVDARIIL
ncbi:MAG TPA: acetate--CoA ligase family protein [Syntrophorhabdaceae bacterium]|nr:acetate--CoA ligase family protein [Syntrophorhabdaceae bacterium]